MPGCSPPQRSARNSAAYRPRPRSRTSDPATRRRSLRHRGTAPPLGAPLRGGRLPRACGPARRVHGRDGSSPPTAGGPTTGSHRSYRHRTGHGACGRNSPQGFGGGAVLDVLEHQPHIVMGRLPRRMRLGRSVGRCSLSDEPTLLYVVVDRRCDMLELGTGRVPCFFSVGAAKESVAVSFETWRVTASGRPSFSWAVTSRCFSTDSPQLVSS